MTNGNTSLSWFITKQNMNGCNTQMFRHTTKATTAAGAIIATRIQNGVPKMERYRKAREIQIPIMTEN